MGRLTDGHTERLRVVFIFRPQRDGSLRRNAVCDVAIFRTHSTVAPIGGLFVRAQLCQKQCRKTGKSTAIRFYLCDKRTIQRAILASLERTIWLQGTMHSRCIELPSGGLKCNVDTLTGHTRTPIQRSFRFVEASNEEYSSGS